MRGMNVPFLQVQLPFLNAFPFRGHRGLVRVELQDHWQLYLALLKLALKLLVGEVDVHVECRLAYALPHGNEHW